MYKGPRYAWSIESAELELVMKYIGFRPHPGEKHHGYYGKHSSHSQRVVFLSLELETAAVALLTTVDLQSIDSVCRLSPGH